MRAKDACSPNEYFVSFELSYNRCVTEFLETRMHTSFYIF